VIVPVRIKPPRFRAVQYHEPPPGRCRSPAHERLHVDASDLWLAFVSPLPHHGLDLLL